MAEFRDVARAYKRMCDAFESCIYCPFYVLTKGRACASDITKYYSEEAERIIMKWAAEHPIVTNGMKFKEIFGDHVVWESDEAMEAWLDAEYEGGQDEQN